MTADSQTDPAGVPPAVDASGAAPPIPHVARKITLLILLLVLANGWVLLHFGLELGSLFIVEVALAAGAAATKILLPTDQEAVHASLRKAFYALLRPASLIAGFAILAAITLFSSTVVVKGKDADRVRIGKAEPTFSDAEKAIFYRGTWLGGSTVRLTMGEATLDDVTLVPWFPKEVRTANFQYVPSILLRVPHDAHAHLDGGAIEVYDAKTNELIASAPTSSASASLLLGRRASVAPTETWELELSGKSGERAQGTRTRWRSYTQPRDARPVSAGQALKAVYKTPRQLEKNDPNDVSAVAEFEVIGGQALQDVVLQKVGRNR